jgi:hypothetical protein
MSKYVSTHVDGPIKQMLDKLASFMFPERCLSVWL